jgi:hypothetical protein
MLALMCSPGIDPSKLRVGLCRDGRDEEAPYPSRPVAISANRPGGVGYRVRASGRGRGQHKVGADRNLGRTLRCIFAPQWLKEVDPDMLATPWATKRLGVLSGCQR